ncbi:S1C family serine protease [Bacillaceae bacterium W0354]
MCDDKRPETIDEEDLYEDLDEEEIYDLLQEKKKEIRQKEIQPKPKRPFPKWVFWLIALFMLISVAPGFISLPAIEFLKTSAKLLVDDDVKEYKQSIVLIDTGSGRGTGFSITEDGYIITNEHVVDEVEHLYVFYPELGGPYEANIEVAYPQYDLALLKVDDVQVPFLPLADEAAFSSGEHFYFIGNPLSFSGIANEGKVIDWTNSSLATPVLMLDAPIYRGNSGSPVINDEGEVIAVIYATRHDTGEGRVGLAIPIEVFHELTNKNFMREQ